MTPCKECQRLHKEWFEAECAFEWGSFSSKNWNCWTMYKLREKYWWFKDIKESLDDYATLIPFDIDNDLEGYYNGFVYMKWYKNRGKTDQLEMVTPGFDIDIDEDFIVNHLL